MTAEYIYAHDYTYDFLVLYFLPEIFDPFFREDYAAEIDEDERLAYSRYIAALLPYEKDYDQIIQCLYDKEDAIAASSLFIPYAICPGMVVDRMGGSRVPRT